MIANIMRKKEAKAYTVFDFMPADAAEVDPLADSWDNLRKLARLSDGEH